jgi:hypothetical protein
MDDDRPGHGLSSIGSRRPVDDDSDDNDRYRSSTASRGAHGMRPSSSRHDVESYESANVRRFLSV